MQRSPSRLEQGWAEAVHLREMKIKKKIEVVEEATALLFQQTLLVEEVSFDTKKSRLVICLGAGGCRGGGGGGGYLFNGDDGATTSLPMTWGAYKSSSSSSYRFGCNTLSTR